MSVPPPSPPKKLQQDYSTMGTPRLPTCNFCEQLYDPYDRHTCVGNDIPAKFKRSIPKPKDDPKPSEGYDIPSGKIGLVGEHGCDLEIGLTRQQIGEALDADRFALDVEREILHRPLRERPDTVVFNGALFEQAGGDHYRKMKIQPVEYIIANDIGFLPGNIIKYASRYPEKGGAEDIRKIIHYCKLILEFEYGERNGG